MRARGPRIIITAVSPRAPLAQSYLRAAPDHFVRLARADCRLSDYLFIARPTLISLCGPAITAFPRLNLAGPRASRTGSALGNGGVRSRAKFVSENRQIARLALIGRDCIPSGRHLEALRNWLALIISL